jgi:hypothetical protein
MWRTGGSGAKQRKSIFKNVTNFNSFLLANSHLKGHFHEKSCEIIALYYSIV